MSISQTLNLENHKKIADAIFEALLGKTFTIVSSYSVIPGEQLNITELMDCQLVGTFSSDGGMVSMPLLPNRKIFWDVTVEKVVVFFKDNGVIQISRILQGNGRVLYRTIIPNSDPA